MSPQEGSCQKYEIVSTFVKVMQRKLWLLFFRPRCVGYAYFFHPFEWRLSISNRVRLSVVAVVTAGLSLIYQERYSGVRSTPR